MPGNASDSRDKDPARLEIKLLGTVEVILDGQRIRAFNSPRLHRFIALLVLDQRPQQRSKLAFQLWPDSGESQARTNLRKLLHELRRSLPDIDQFVAIDNETVSWKSNGPSNVDVLRFRNAVATGDLDLATRLYTGDLLPASYEDWVLEERECLRREIYETLKRLVTESISRADHQTTLRYTQNIIRLEPTDETMVLASMDAHLALENPSAALRCYHRYLELLEKEFDASPGEAIKARYRELRGGDRGPESNSAEETLSVAESPFVGRSSAWNCLIKTWDTACGGQAHLVLVSGEAGIGKSRLANELGRRVHSTGHPVASARAYEAAGRLPWGPVVDLLRSHALRKDIDALDSVWKTELARLLPELLDGSESEIWRRSSEAAQRHRLFDAVSRAFVSCKTPRLLIIDDLQWCDTETIEILGYVISSWSTAPILVVGTCRSEEIQENHPLTDLVAALTRIRAVTTIPLDRFDKSTTIELTERMCKGKKVDSQLADRIWCETEGNPLFVVEALRAGFSAQSDQPLLTPTMRQVLGARLNSISENARRVTEIAAVIGRPFSIAMLTAIAGTDETTIIDAVDELWRNRIIVDQRSDYDFSHDKLRAVALERISPVRLRQIHRAIATALAADFNCEVEAASARLAAHYDKAGMVESAIDAYQSAGSRAVAVSANEEAVSMYQRALALLAELSPAPARDLLELEIRIALGSPLVALEGYGSRESHHLYERAFALCRKLNTPVHPPIYRGLGLARLQGCEFEECDKLARALTALTPHDSISQTEGHYLLGVSAFWKGTPELARQSLNHAIESYDPERRHEHLVWYAQDPKAICLVRLGLAQLWIGDTTSAESSARAALKIARDLDHLMTLGYVYTYAAIHAAEAENTSGLAELLQDADQLWQRLSERYLLVVLDALRGWLEVDQGSAAGIDKILKSVVRSRQQGETLHLTYTMLLLARARIITGAYHDGRVTVREALAWTQRCNQRYLESELWRIDGELAYRLGERDNAFSSMHRAADVANAQGAGWLELRALHTLAERFPNPELGVRLAALGKAVPSIRGLPTFHTACELLKI